MNSTDAKNITKLVIETFNEEGILDNKFFDEFKFRARCYKSLVSSDMAVNDHSKILELAMTLANDIIDENLELTTKSLVDKGLITETKDDSGKTVFKLNN